MINEKYKLTIKYLKKIQEDYIEGCGVEALPLPEWYALDDAIKILETQPCDDCVSREAVEKITWEEPSYDDALNVLTEVRDKVRALPSVTPKGVTITDFADRCRECGKTKTGHWIKTGNYYTGAYGCLDYFECSCCHEESLEEGDFCPNCGADMRGDANE